MELNLPSGLSIREIQESDIPAVLRVWEETGMGGVARGDGPEVILRTLRHGGVMYVLIAQEVLIGTSWITSDGRRLYLHHFSIRPAWQGRGYARYLLNASLAFAKSMKMQIKLEVHRNNDIAVNLYKKAGFNYLGDYDVYIIRNIDQFEIQDERT
ncbi:MAG: GNAT family N-acetyltransferase [Lentimicrobiaceae bacterium]|nr:GNAT family N-acetyltransferase [Lentimicrobiaceae bacterium]